MSDPRNVAHAKKVTQEKKHQGTEARPADAPVAQPGKKQPAAKKKTVLAESAVSFTRGLGSNGTEKTVKE
jgi:hypothetical protein